MKKIFPFLLLSLIISAMFILIFNTKEKVTPKIITVDTLHSYLYKNNQLIEIPIYVSAMQEVFSEISAYENIYIFNSDDKKLFLDLKEITTGHSELYLGDNYQKIILKFEMPNLSEDFIIENAYMNISLINDHELALKIGELSLTYLNNTSDLDWLTLDSKRNIDNNEKVQMDYIIIELNEEVSSIEMIKIANNNALEYEIIENTIIITIPNYNLVINYIPLWIAFNDGSIQTFNNHHYIIEYSLLEKAGRLLNIYVLT
ncbi:MAG TPA: hypothetical protein GX695_06630 [Acholeplasmataceae bacterium]|nr:hypothetical protein [Acholeplasmataceae bacterium]